MNRVLFRCMYFLFLFLFKRTLSPKLPLLYSLLWEWLHFVALPLHSLSLQHHPLPHPISLHCTLLYIVLFVVEAKPCSFGSPSANLPFMFMYDDWLIKERPQHRASYACHPTLSHGGHQCRWFLPQSTKGIWIVIEFIYSYAAVEHVYTEYDEILSLICSHGGPFHKQNIIWDYGRLGSVLRLGLRAFSAWIIPILLTLQSLICIRSY